MSGSLSQISFYRRGYNMCYYCLNIDSEDFGAMNDNEFDEFMRGYDDAEDDKSN